ncbi:hypothetical protein SEVIR_2G013200v4 [Setaria viridis]|uniref:uncharacterized protein n=1 Tax=Setaria viridis TaxID=4556 RepID=UPI001493C503|nr:uncharacterized protein LOC117843560 [Setaria viridis]
MELFLSAVLSDLASRSINFIFNKCSKLPSPAVEDSLRRALLRAQVIVDESMRRHITNQAMLQQLNMLRDTMHQGNYMLDIFRCKPDDEEEEDTKHKIVSHPLLLNSRVNCVRDFLSSRTSAQILKEMQQVLDRLSSMIHDANELVLFLASYPPMYRQPYSMHLLLGNCMFGRQMEAQLAINFLLHTRTHGAEELEVLPIVGPYQVGKRTLVAHVCKDERVRDYFSEIVLWTDDHEFRDEKITIPREGHDKIFQNCAPNKEGRILVIVELAADFNEVVWKRLYSASKRCLPSGSKIIVTSQSDKVVKYGTTRALTLNYMSQEEYWYFFKILTFGSVDPEMHPRLTQMAMEISRMHNCCFIAAHLVSYLLRDNFDIHFWHKVLIFLKEYIQNHVSKFGEGPFDDRNQSKPVHLQRMATPSEVIMVSNPSYRSSQEEVPKIRLDDVIYKNVRPHGKFEALVWRSQIPPYYSYTTTCEIQELKNTGTKRKRNMKSGVTFC